MRKQLIRELLESQAALLTEDRDCEKASVEEAGFSQRQGVRERQISASRIQIDEANPGVAALLPPVERLVFSIMFQSYR